MNNYKLSLIGYVGAGSELEASKLLISSLKLNNSQSLILDVKCKRTRFIDVYSGIAEFKVSLIARFTAVSEPMAIRGIRESLNLPVTINIVVEGKE